MYTLEDSFGRRFPYLRLSVTDVCNFRCQYCLPNGYKKTDRSFLSIDEITRLIKAFAGLGVWKIRLTGGEPTVRSDFIEIARRISSIAGIRKIACTTNGFKLARDAGSYLQAGITSVNVSVDSLNPEHFKEITGHDVLPTVLKGITAAETAGFQSVKVNAVLIRGKNDDELDLFLEWVKREPISVRFIELMQTGENNTYFQEHHISGEIIASRLVERGWSEIPRADGDGPARKFAHPAYQGQIGIIAPYAKDFCKSCNRLRVTARGDLRLCLFGDTGYPLRPLLQSDDQQDTLQQKILELLHFKTKSHSLLQGNSGITSNLASVGG